MSLRKTSLLLGSFLAASQAFSAITVNFSGTLDQFNTGPFNAGDVFVGSFELDDSVTASGSLNDFVGGVDNFQLTVGGESFSGENGNLRQYSTASGSTDFFSISIGNGKGTLSGDASGVAINQVSLDWRGANLFDDPTVYANNLETSDFGFTRVTLDFDSSTAIDNATSISINEVPVPAAAWLFGSALMGLVSVKRKKS